MTASQFVCELAAVNLTAAMNAPIVMIGGRPGRIFEGEVPNGPFGDYRNKKYVEFQSGVGILRRFENTPSGLSDTIIDICSKSSDGNFVLGASVGSITYEIPKNYDPSILLKLDEIVKTIKAVN